MVVDHMIFNKKKWYEGNVPNYIGKTIDGVESNIPAFTYTSIYSKNYERLDEQFDRYSSFSSKFLNGLKIIGQASLGNGEILLMIPQDIGQSNSYARTLFIKLSDLIKNGGIRHSPLSHIRQCLQSLFRNEVIACL